MDHELLILGAGPGGYEAAIRAAQLGLNVGLIERDAVGGTCLNRGCIPTKTLLHDAGPGADFLALNAHKEQVVSTLRQGVEGLLKKRRVTVYRGTGMLTDDHTIEVDGQAVTGEKLLLAPGSRPALPPPRWVSTVEIKMTGTSSTGTFLPKCTDSMTALVSLPSTLVTRYSPTIISPSTGSRYRIHGCAALIWVA